MDCSTPRFLVLHYLLEFAQTHFHWAMPSNNLILCHPFLLLPSIFPRIRIFSNELAVCIRWPKYWSFRFSISPSNEYSELISLGLTDLISLESKGFSKILSSTTVQKHQFLGARPSLCPTLTSIRDYWKNRSFDYMDLCEQIDVSFFKMLSRFVIAFLPRSNRGNWKKKKKMTMLENYNWEKDNYGDLSPLKEKTSTFWISDIHRIMMQNKSQWDLKRFQEKKQTS